MRTARDPPRRDVIQSPADPVEARMGRVSPSWVRPATKPARSRVGPAHVGVVASEASLSSCMPTNDELNEWMHAVARSADRTAFAALFRHFAPRLKGYLVRAGSPEPLAEELAQEAMVQLWRRAASFDPARAQLSTWLYTILRHLSIDQHRRAAGVLTESLDLDDDAFAAPDTGPTPDDQVLAGQRERGVRAALAALPPEQAQVLHLSFYEDHAHAAIAERLGIPLGTVKSRIRLAVGQLRRLLDGYEA